MKNFLSSIYNKFVKSGRLKEEDVPKDISIEDEDTNVEEHKEEVVEEPVNTIYGALYIPSSEKELDIVSMVDGSCFDSVASYDIFTKSILNGKPYPEDIKYSIIRVEPNNFIFAGKPKITLEDIDNGFNLIFNGNIKINVLPRTSLFRIDIRISSSNYEDMILSTYYIAK